MKVALLCVLALICAGCEDPIPANARATARRPSWIFVRDAAGACYRIKNFGRINEWIPVGDDVCRQREGR